MSLEDQFYRFLNIYKTLPNWSKALLAYPFRVLPREYYLGKNYKLFYQDALDLDFASKKNIQEYQFNKLKKVLYEAYNFVPYYREEWDRLGINLNQIQSFSDFHKYIPSLEKEDVQKNPIKFLSSKYPIRTYMKQNTGGSTGIPLTLYYLRGHSRLADRAYTDFMWHRIGYKVGKRMARLRGDYFGKQKISSFDPYRNTLMLSSFALTKNNANKYIDLLRKYKIEYISAYPSSLVNLVQLANNFNGFCPHLKGIMLGSENIFEWQTDLIKDFFQIDNILYDYGQGELTVWAATCTLSHKYHFHPGFSYVEFKQQDSTNNTTNNETSVFEIIGTGFYNPLMPLIRYKTNDMGLQSNSKCKCGRNHKILDTILGRKQEMAIGFNGEKVTLTALIFGRHTKFLHHIYKMQVINTSPGELNIKIIAKNTFNFTHEKKIIKTLSKEQGMPFNCNVERVNEIPTTKNGKHKFLIKSF